MPKYIVPVSPASEEGLVYPPNAAVYLPANKEIIDQLAIDGMVEITIKGRVMSLENRESNLDSNRYEFEVEIKEIEAYPENEFSELAKDDDDEAY